MLQKIAALISNKIAMRWNQEKGKKKGTDLFSPGFPLKDRGNDKNAVKMERDGCIFPRSLPFLRLYKIGTVILHPLKFLKNCAGVNIFIPIYSLIPPDLPLEKGGTVRICRRH